MPRTRANGDGAIYKRPDGRWTGRYFDADGKRHDLYGKNRGDVKDKLDRAQENVRKALPVLVARETVAQFMDRWLRDVAAQRVRETTLERYQGDVRLHIVPKLGKRKLTEVTPAVAQAFLNELHAEGLGARSVAHCRAVLRVALGRALREGLVGQNVAKLVDVPRETPKPVDALTPGDARALLDAFKGHEYEALITVALATGMRQGELLGLSWEDVDLDAGTLTVRRQLQRIGGQDKLVELKTRRSRRTLALPSVAVEALRAQRARQNETRLALGTDWQGSGRVFTTATGGFLNGSSVTHRYQARLKDAGLPVRSFHHLRHGAASLLLAKGASMRVVMEQLGHSQITLTMNTYAHIAPELLRDAADKLNAALGGA